MATAAVFYSVNTFGTGDLKTGSPNISITSGVATLSVAQTGNIGAGCKISWSGGSCYIAPNRMPFNSGGTYVTKVLDIITGDTSGAKAQVIAVEITSGSFAGGDAAGYFYLGWNNGVSFNGSENVSVRGNSNVATQNGAIQGNMSTEFVVKTATGGAPGDTGSTAVTSIAHEYASASAFESGFTDASHVNNTDLTVPDVAVYAMCYDDHVDHTADGSLEVSFGTTGANNSLSFCTVVGKHDSVANGRHSGKWTSTAYRMVASQTFYQVVTLTEAYLNIVGIQVENTGAKNSQSRGVRINDASGTASEIALADSIIRATGSGTPAASCNGIQSSANHKLRLVGNIVYDYYTGIIIDYINTVGLESMLYNNTCHNNSSIGISHGGGTNPVIRVVNNICNSNGTDYSLSGVDYSATNISEDTSSPDVSYRSLAVSFVDEANDDFHLASGDTAAKGAGTNLSADSYFPFSYDIDMDIISTWSIGADAQAAAGGGGLSIPVAMHHYRNLRAA